MGLTTSSHPTTFMISLNDFGKNFLANKYYGTNDEKNVGSFTEKCNSIAYLTQQQPFECIDLVPQLETV